MFDGIGIPEILAVHDTASPASRKGHAGIAQKSAAELAETLCALSRRKYFCVAVAPSRRDAAALTEWIGVVDVWRARWKWPVGSYRRGDRRTFAVAAAGALGRRPVHRSAHRETVVQRQGRFCSAGAGFCRRRFAVAGRAAGRD